MKNKDWNKFARALILCGALNWGLIGLFGLNLVGAVLGPFARIVYIAIGWAALYKLSQKKGDD